MGLRVQLKRQLATLDLQVADDVADRLLWLQAEMLRWNRTYNLTAVTDPLEALEKHLVDSLTLLPHIPDAAAVLDIGSGAGFPGLPLKIARPDVSVVSVDAVAKKIAFQKHVVRTLKLDRFMPWHGRAENLPEQTLAADGFDVITARAFSSLPRLIEIALPCLAAGGIIVAMKGPEGERELTQAAAELQLLGVACREVVRLELPSSGAERQLQILEKQHKM